jgi:acyl carrier protein
MDEMKEVEAAVLSNLSRYAAGASGTELKDRLLKEHLGIKSLQMASLLTAICDVIDVDLFLLSDLDIVRMKTVQNVIDILAEKKASSDSLQTG